MLSDQMTPLFPLTTDVDDGMRARTKTNPAFA